jgi:hypothetical protein
MRQNNLPRVYLDTKKSIGQGFYDFAVKLYSFFAFVGLPEVLSAVRNNFQINF